MNLLLVEPGEIDAGGKVKLGGRRGEHIRRVLRAEPGKILRAGVIGGGVGRARVLSVSADEVELAIEIADSGAGEPPPSWVDLIVALPRPAVVHRVLQNAAAMGVGKLELVNAWRVEKSFFSSPALHREAIRRHLVLGAEQGMTTRLPEVRLQPLLVPFVEGLAARADPPQRILTHPDADRPIEAVFTGDDGGRPFVAWPVAARLELAVGPEGGWIDREVETFRRAGFRPASLGPWILRVETAVTAALAQAELLRRQAFFRQQHGGAC